MFAEIFINRPVTAIVASIIIVALGVLALLSLPVGQYPDITPPVVQVTSNYTGADAQTVEQTVATPIETQVNGTPGMSYVQTNATNDGRMTMNVTFDVGTDVNIAALDVQNRVGIATPQLPEEVTRLGVTVRKRNPSLFMLVAIFSPKGTHNVSFLDNYTNVYIRDALLRVKGVGDIFSRADDFSMRIWLKPDRLAQLGMTADDVTAALQEQNLQVAGGSVGGPPQPSSQAFEYTVFTNSRISKETEFENIVVRSDPARGSLVYLKDVARVQLGKFSYASNSFVDGKRAAYLLVYQLPGSNALSTAQGVYAAMDQLKKTFPKDIDYVVPFESVSVIQVSISEVVQTLLEALVLVILVVFLFLQSWRATLITLLAIPVSIIGTFALFVPLGFTINTLTLFAFVLAIGIVVDDAIVVVEAVQANIDEKGLSPRDATREAMREISAPVIAIALILAAVFVPVGFIPGIVGRLYQQFAITIAVSVLISAFVALSLTPALCTLLLREQHIDENAKGLNKFFYKFNQWFGRVTNSYSNGVQRLIKATPLVLVGLAVVYVGTVLMFRAKPTGFIPTEDEGRLIVTYEIPEAASTARSLAVLNRVMDTLRRQSYVNHFAALGGLNAITFASKSNSGTVFMSLKPWEERKERGLQADSLVVKLQRALSSINDARVQVVQPPAIPGLGQSSGFTFEIQQRETNDDVRAFDGVVQNFLAEANKRPEIGRAFTYFTAKSPAYRVDVDRDKCKKLGLSVSNVYRTIQTYLGSQYINDFIIYGRKFRVVAQADTMYRSDLKALNQFYVRNSNNQLIPISNVITTSVIENAPLISHFNLFRSVELNGAAKPGFSSSQANDALREVADKVLPAGYSYDFSGLSREEINAGSSSVYIFLLSVGFVFLFLAALYESWSVPFSVLLSVPLGALGAIIALLLFPYLSNNVYAQIGLITLIGLAAKNAILIVEFAKERVDKGEDLLESTIEAVRLRLRPILMTSLAFILGVIPLALATGAGGVARATIGRTVLGGMLAATSLAIFVVPVLYVGITRLAYGKKGLEALKKNAQKDKPDDASQAPEAGQPQQA
ncbi:transporter, hydrophobe/amphiphile efflux-1 (HAE1) family [Fibrella aestuarina BUZ 2]|uniref:Transporter, hydrophobe/amphiphile efflux-1 (HAE1) family n=1 Tax=Fibrella aestuarina BUZ 2 TaxID=1166018 RepID=I0KGP3_9BACT|nr:efflux RND transporter permease subunit [Fibrella aestuarina]CCH03296.1 transporter, hydrophobe/amphiphile efflux-1 (HAE1) family [Fibrella aestuarina BUZ 2]